MLLNKRLTRDDETHFRAYASIPLSARQLRHALAARPRYRALRVYCRRPPRGSAITQLPAIIPPPSIVFYSAAIDDALGGAILMQLPCPARHDYYHCA